MSSGDEAGRVVSPRARTAGRTRWWIVWTLFFSTVTNYISRQTFSVLSPVIAAQFHLNHTDLAKIIGAFQLSYALTWLLGGIFLDAVGTRIGLMVAVVWWSLVNVLMGFATSVGGFVAFRFMLGMGEGLNWPGATKAVAEWFPSEERSVAVAIFDSGSSVGGALAALIIPWIALVFGWRWSFVFSGALGFVWLALWLHVYHPLSRHPRVRPEEVALIRSGQEMPSTSKEKGVRRWVEVLKSRNAWGIGAGPGVDGSDLVVLCLLAAAVPERCAGVQPEADCAVCVAAVCGGGRWELYGRVSFGVLHSPGAFHCACADAGVRGELPADPGRDTGGAGA